MFGFCKKKITALYQEFSSYSSREKIFITFAMLCGFFICCEYSLIRPVSNSLFISHFSSRLLPYAWLGLVPFNFALVSLYNRLIPKWGSKRLFIALIMIVICTNILVAVFSKKIPFLSFAFYMWKDLYILLMFQLVWSVIHVNVRLQNAQYLYGIFYGIGGLGSILGSSFPGFFAVAYGSENIIFLSIPIYLVLLFVYWKMCTYSNSGISSIKEEEKGGFAHGLKLISGSRFLIFALLIVLFMQMIAAVVDFQFQDFIERIFHEKDARTEYSARIFGIMHMVTVLFQFVGSFIIIKWMGVRKAHYFVPFTLLCFAGLFALFPIFPLVSLMFISCKSLDFSIFGVLKEMLYIPLKPDEKFRAKAIIDVFAYRSSKAFASILILFFTHFISVHLLTWLNLMLAMGWIFCISYGLREYETIKQPV